VSITVLGAEALEKRADRLGIALLNSLNEERNTKFKNGWFHLGV